jgi:hypothetical protein
VETATYSSEFIATCTCIDQVVNLKSTLCYLGALSVMSATFLVSYIFGDNKTVVQSATPPMPSFISAMMHSLFTRYKRQSCLNIS